MFETHSENSKSSRVREQWIYSTNANYRFDQEADCSEEEIILQDMSRLRKQERHFGDAMSQV